MGLNLFDDDSYDEKEQKKKIIEQVVLDAKIVRADDENVQSYFFENLFVSDQEELEQNRIEPQDAIYLAQKALKKRHQSDWLAAVDEVEGQVVQDEVVKLESGDFVTLNARHPFDYQGGYPQYPKIESPFADLLGTWLFKPNGVDGHQTFELLPNGTVIYSDPWPVGSWISAENGQICVDFDGKIHKFVQSDCKKNLVCVHPMKFPPSVATLQAQAAQRF